MNCIRVSQEVIFASQMVCIGGDSAHHLRNVLRVKHGDKVKLLDGIGHCREAVVETADKKTVSLSFVEEVKSEVEPVPLELFQCIAKPSHMDWLVEKCCELGLTRLNPVLSARTVARASEGEVLERWNRIVDSALCQSNSAWATDVAPVSSWDVALSKMVAFPGPVVVCSLAPDARPIGEALANLPSSAGGIAIVVGPEGDFSPDELASVCALPNAVPVSLGKNVLRVETAAIFAIVAAKIFCAAR